VTLRASNSADIVGDILLAYFGLYGHTRKVCECLQAELAQAGRSADVVPIAEADPSAYGTVVIGAAIRNGKHNPAVYRFIERHRALLDERPSAFFSVNLVARKPEKNTPETNPYVKAFTEKCPWRPKLLGVFAGNLDYARYGVADRNIIRFIMWLTGGPTDPKTRIEYTNWDEVRRFAQRVASLAPARGP
jgi:menaquinone-dependent protoporphyrinogen oxidase